MRFVFPLLALLAVPALAAAAGIEYKTEIVGIEDKALLSELRQASQLVALEDRRPDSETALARRAASDRERLDTVLRAEGYYDAEIAFDIDAESRPAIVRVRVTPGQRYNLARVDFNAPDGRPLPPLANYAPLAFGLKIGGPARSAPVLAAERQIARALAERGFPLARVADRRVVVDKATKTMDVAYSVDAGPPAAFGPTRINGLDQVELDYVRRRIAWREGEPYDARLVERTRRSLVASGLFATARAATADAVGPDGRIPIDIDVTERPHRSIGLGLNYDTTLGASARAFWEHRNVFGDAERLRLSSELGQRRQNAIAAFRRPDVFSVDQDLIASITAENEQLEAYDRTRLVAFTGLERRISDQVTVGGGAQVERSHTDERVRTRDYTLVGTPLFLRRDATDNLLNPTRGTRQTLTLTPYLGPIGSDLTFLSSRLSGSAYLSLDDRSDYVLAGFAAIGSIVGESRDVLPKDKRLYAGGGGSVRGYGYQRAGPLDEAGDPIGGRSSLEGGIELRVKITEAIGVAPFVEAGTVYESTVPDFSERMFVGTGIGLRYYTPIGPVRLDVGFPLNRRREDDAFQVYVSLGQAF